MSQLRQIVITGLGACVAVALSAPVFAAAWDAGAGKDWEALMAAARQEGQVVVSACPALTESIGKAFKQDTGINISFATGSPAELTTKFDTEVKSGRLLTDAKLAGPNGLPYVPQGVLVPIAEKLYLPSVTTGSNWTGGKLNWLDSQQKYLPVPAEYVGGWPVVNSDLVDPKSIKTWSDLLKPEFKGKIIAMDPLDQVGWATSQYIAHLKGVDFMAQLYKSATLVRERRQVVEGLARGIYAVGLSADAAPELETFRASGFTSLKSVTMEDGPGNLIGGCSVLAVPVKSPHPNAALVFANWFLSPRGQEAYVAGQHQPTNRIDVSNAGVDPNLIPKPGLDYFGSYREDWVLRERPVLVEQITKAMAK